ncbi:hypothetical protein HK097_010551, partial [Rhizophlyctis rosea]
MVLLPLSCFGGHTLKTDLNLNGTLRVYSDVATTADLRNRNGIMAVNNVSSSNPVSLEKEKGIATISLKHDDSLELTTEGDLSVVLNTAAPVSLGPNRVIGLSHDGTLQLTPEGKLSVVPKILMQADLDMRARAPLKLILDPDVNPNDPIGSKVLLDFVEDDFNVTDEGKLAAVPLNITSQGAIKVRKADLLLGEDDKKLRVIGINVGGTLQQTGGILDIRNQGPGRIPFFQIGSGLTSNAHFSLDGASTLSVPFIKLTESFTLPDNYACPVGYAMQAYQAGVNTGLDIEPPVNGRRIVRVRCNPFSMRVNGANQLEVNTGNTMKQDADGVDVKHDISIKEDLALGIGVNLSETSRGLSLIGDGLTVNTQELDPIKSGFDGLYLQLSPDDSCLAKTTTGLEVTTAPDGPLRKEILGLDIAVGPRLKKGLLGLEGNYVGESPDITVSENLIICNISVSGKGIQKLGSVISLTPEIEEKLQEVDDMKESLDNAVDNLDDLGDRLDNVAENLSNIAEQVLSTAAQIGTAAAAGAVGGGISSGLALTAAGKLAKDGVQSLISANAAKVIGGGLAAALLAGILGGLLGSLGGKKTYNTYIIGDQGISNSGVPEGETEPVWGYSISQEYNWDPVKYPNKQTSPMTIGGML